MYVLHGSGPPLSGYMVVRDGEFFVGSRCSPSLVEIGVFLNWPKVSRSDPSYFDTAVWHAIAPNGVNEFDLFAADQAGVTVVSDRGGDLSSSYLYIDVRGRNGQSTTMLHVMPTQLDPALVGTPRGPMTWEEFMAIPSRDFGCR